MLHRIVPLLSVLSAPKWSHLPENEDILCRSKLAQASKRKQGHKNCFILGSVFYAAGGYSGDCVSYTRPPETSGQICILFGDYIVIHPCISLLVWLDFNVEGKAFWILSITKLKKKVGYGEKDWCNGNTGKSFHKIVCGTAHDLKVRYGMFDCNFNAVR